MARCAREYQDPALFASSHRFTVDACAVRHPGRAGDPRASRSVWLHFAGLHAMVAERRLAEAAAGLIRRLAGRSFPRPPPATAWTTTLADVLVAGEAAHEPATAH